MLQVLRKTVTLYHFKCTDIQGSVSLAMPI